MSVWQYVSMETLSYDLIRPILRFSSVVQTLGTLDVLFIELSTEGF